MNLPNSLTITRIFLVPLLVVVLLTKFEGSTILGFSKELVGAAIFAIASITDWLDGYLARRRKQITPLGQVIDPLADKLLTSAAFISLVQMDLAPAWMVAVIIGREFGLNYDYEVNYRDLKKHFATQPGGNWLVLAPVPFGPLENAYPGETFKPRPPDWERGNYLGTDQINRDILARLLYGFRNALIFAGCFIVLTYLIGITLGCLMGYFGGWFDLLVQRLPNEAEGTGARRVRHDAEHATAFEILGRAGLRDERSRESIRRSHGRRLGSVQPGSWHSFPWGETKAQQKRPPRRAEAYDKHSKLSWCSIVSSTVTIESASTPATNQLQLPEPHSV